MEPAPRIELGPPPYRGVVLPLSPSRHSWDAWIRTTTATFNARQPAVSRRPIEPPAGIEPATFSVQASCACPVAPRRRALDDACGRGRRPQCVLGRALGGIRTRNIQHLGLASLPIGVRARASLWADSNGLLRCTRTPLCQVSYRGTAAGQRLELQFTASGAVVLPLDDPASGVELLAECAARDSNPRSPD